MKIKLLSITTLVLLLLLFGFKGEKPENSNIDGAWKLQQGSIEQVVLFSNGYFMHTTFDKENKKFIGSRGGAYNYSGSTLNATIEFNTADKEEIGKQIAYRFRLADKRLDTDITGTDSRWAFVDNGKGELAGTWRSSGRMQDGKVVLSPPRARKTFKILTGTRFQWAAINAETKEFFGTGGGTYTFANGKYTENIEFFSRDDSRVGATLSFDGKVEGDLWHHSGLSSAGAPIYEIWKMEK